MKKLLKLTLTSIQILSFPVMSYSASCEISDQQEKDVHKDEKLPFNKVTYTKFSNGVIHFRANMDVNTDGSSRSYHPDNVGAQNILCNGINVLVPKSWNGKNALVEYYRKLNPNKLDVVVNGVGSKGSLSGKQTCSLMMDLYKEAKQNNWVNSDNVPRVIWSAIAYEEKAQQNGKVANIPCIQNSTDPSPGFFVSTTSYQDYSKNVCDVKRYADADRVSNIVLPNLKLLTNTWNINTGSPALVVKNGNVTPTVVGDTGPIFRVGEGSTKLARKIKGAVGTVNYPIDYFVFSKVKIKFTQDDTDIEKQTNLHVKDIGFDVKACLELVKK